MNFRGVWPLIVLLTFTTSVGAFAQQDEFGSPRPHPWGKFAAGTWVEKVVHIEQGKEVVEGTLRMEMVEKTEQQATLKVDMSTKDSKRPTQMTKLDTAVASLRPEGEESLHAKETLDIGGQKYECEVREYKREEGKNNISMKIWFSSLKPGYYLRSESKAEREGKHVKVIRQILRFDEKVKVGNREIPCIVREEVQTGDGPNFTKTLWESEEVPGGEVRSEQVMKTNAGSRQIREIVTGFESR